MPSVLKIGTRKSELAVWQAEFVRSRLTDQGIDTEIVFIESQGEVDSTTPLYEMGVTGIFTRALDTALLDERVDIAVHSLKDVPTVTAKGLTITAVPGRGNFLDTLAYKDQLPQAEEPYTIATSSLRRSSQWLHRFPDHRVVNLRGNINTRLRKLVENKDWNGAIFAAAGIERIDLTLPNRQDLDWMLPAPGQGALAVVCRVDDDKTREIIEPIDHAKTRIETTAERMFLRTLMGGCSMPIAALAEIKDDILFFEGLIMSIDGQHKAAVKDEFDPADELAGKRAAETVLKRGGVTIIEGFNKR